MMKLMFVTGCLREEMNDHFVGAGGFRASFLSFLLFFTSFLLEVHPGLTCPRLPAAFVLLFQEQTVRRALPPHSTVRHADEAEVALRVSTVRPRPT